MDKDAALQVFGADEVHYSSEVGNKEARVGQGRTRRVGQGVPGSEGCSRAQEGAGWGRVGQAGSRFGAAHTVTTATLSVQGNRVKGKSASLSRLCVADQFLCCRYGTVLLDGTCLAIPLHVTASPSLHPAASPTTAAAAQAVAIVHLSPVSGGHLL